MDLKYPNGYDDEFINTIKMIIDIIRDRGVDILSEEGIQQAIVTWLEDNRYKPRKPVATLGDLPTSAELKEFRLVESENKQYMYNGTEWVEFGAVNADGLTLFKNDVDKLEKDINKTLISKPSERRPMMTFVDDDGMEDVLIKWEPILQEKRNKLTIAIVPTWVESPTSPAMGWDEVHRLHDTYGVEVVNHTYEHKHAYDITDEEIDAEFGLAKEALNQQGFKGDIIVQPFGENNKAVREISRKYAKANISTKEGINYPPQETFRMYRITLAEETNNTWAHYKSVLDEAIANDGWVIFKSHSQYTSFDETQIQLIKDIIDYANANGMLNVDLEEGLDLVGNIIDVGDYPLRDDASMPEYTVMDYAGVIHSRSNSKDFYARRYNSASATSHIDDFPSMAVTMDTIVSSNSSGFPLNLSGTLMTYKTATSNNQFQLYFIYNSDDVYKRRWDTSTDSWTNFVLVMSEKKSKILNIAVGSATVPANSYADVNVSSSDVAEFDFIQGVPRGMLSSNEIIYNVFIPSDGTITVRYHNKTAADITVNAVRYNFRVEKL